MRPEGPRAIALDEDRLPLTAPEAPPERRLALAVLVQALRDARIGHRDAQRFLAGGPMLGFWAAAADLDPDVLRRALDRRRIVAARVTVGDVASPGALFA